MNSAGGGFGGIGGPGKPVEMIIDEVEAEKKPRAREAYIQAVERRMNHPLAVNLLTHCIRAGISELLEKADAVA